MFRAALVAGGSVIALLCSCDEHHPGEYPEVQRDRTAPAHEEQASPGARATPTPVNYFPRKNLRKQRDHG